jgi:hypothetical protein
MAHARIFSSVAVHLDNPHRDSHVFLSSTHLHSHSWPTTIVTIFREEDGKLRLFLYWVSSSSINTKKQTHINYNSRVRKSKLFIKNSLSLLYISAISGYCQRDRTKFEVKITYMSYCIQSSLYNLRVAQTKLNKN